MNKCGRCRKNCGSGTFYGEIDGRSTREFSGALRKYQDRKGFAVSGVLDETTLRSLDLLPARRETAGHSWPEMPVLRSDAAAPPVKAAPQPPPIAEASSAEEFSAAGIRAYIASYLAVCEGADPENELKFYADPLDYFDHAIVDLRFVERDVRKYYKRWPERRYRLVAFSAAPDENRPSEATVTFRLHFSVRNREHFIEGQTDNIFRVKTEGGQNKIVSMRERRVRGD